MKHRIDPKIDCVFKALLGSVENRNLLAHFLNAILASDLRAPITQVDILNPYNDKEFLDDKLSIVDVKARDAGEQIYQIEIQLLGYGHLSARILYTWADIYSQQLQSGNDYRMLKPTYAIWLLAENLVASDTDYLHAYQLRDAKGRILLDHGGIWLLELDKFSTQTVENEQQRWLQFFKAGEQLDDATLPDWMTTPEMRQAMTTLRQFSEKERNYHEYQARQNYLRQQRTIQWEMEEERKEKLQALLREQAALKEKEVALQEKETAMQSAAVAMQKAEVALQEKETAMQKAEAALAEIERLKALLATR
ncbi:MAG TPA: Rpn family recombination-promoting nuclease/putative transposase [Rhodocyclaceae bacterium]|nr:Rpn family recombination-promoting nuclease/putative transposase [Rhodocyclaceae bacterium]